MSGTKYKIISFFRTNNFIKHHNQYLVMNTSCGSICRNSLFHLLDPVLDCGIKIEESSSKCTSLLRMLEIQGGGDNPQRLTRQSSNDITTTKQSCSPYFIYRLDCNSMKLNIEQSFRIMKQAFGFCTNLQIYAKMKIHASQLLALEDALHYNRRLTTYIQYCIISLSLLDVWILNPSC